MGNDPDPGAGGGRGSDGGIADSGAADNGIADSGAADNGVADSAVAARDSAVAARDAAVAARDAAVAARDAAATAARRALADGTTPAWVAAALADASDGDAGDGDGGPGTGGGFDGGSDGEPDNSDGGDDTEPVEGADVGAVADRVAARLVARTLRSALDGSAGPRPGDRPGGRPGDRPDGCLPEGVPAGVADPLADLAAVLARADVASEAVARAYGAVVPPDRRRARGEYYTPRPVRDLVARLTVTAPDDRVLDPACGTGGFLASAARRRRALAAESSRADVDDGPGAGGKEALVGVEVAPEPARLATAVLPADVRVADFFDVAPGDLGGPFDAVVGNPPYVRHEAIADPAAVRAHLDRVDAGDLSRRADLYAYFLTRATEFLAPGGDLGFVTSDRWLDTRYGEDVQRFLLDNYAVRAVVTFDRGVFDDALVDASLLVVRRRTDRAARDRTVTRFVRVRSGLPAGRVADVVAHERPPDRLVDAPGYRVATRRQGALRAEAKWNAYHIAPPVYFELRAHPGTVPLSALADVRYGVKTGANDFFVARADEVAARDLESYAAPFLKATGQVGTVAVTDADGWRVLDAHDAAREALANDDGAGANPGDADPVSALSATGHGALARHVASGERAGYHERPSMRSRTPWFDLGPLPRPRLLATTFTWRVHRVHWNAAGAVPGDQFYAVDPEGVDPATLGGVLNSRVVWLASEVLGRRAGGEGMTRLQTKVYEARRWPVPDPRAMTGRRRERVRRAFRALREREREVGEATAAATAAERDALDRAVLGALPLDRSVEAVLADLKRGVRTMVARRAGREPSPDGRTVVDLPRIEADD